MVRILYVRHGENPANLTLQLSHRTVDHSLTERGRSQAAAVACSSGVRPETTVTR